MATIAAANRRFMTTLMLAIIISFSQLDFTVAQIGVNYGTNGVGLPPPPQAVNLYKQYNIRRMRIYGADHEILQALRGSDIELAVGILNQNLQGLDAGAWVRDNIMAYHPDVKFTHIVVGNEVRPGKPDTQEYVPFVLPVMQNIHNALPPDLRGSIKVTTSVDTEVLDPSSSFPPENGRFRAEVAPYINPIVQFLVDTGAPLFASIYPYFAYINNQAQIDIRYALLDPTFPGVATPGGTYQNLFYALLDAVNAALEKTVDSMSLESSTDAGKQSPPEVDGAESGWPTPPSPGGGRREGGGLKLVSTDAVASAENARAYVNNLIQAVKKGTPRRPDKPIRTYIFALFDENMKPGNDDERNFGLFFPDGRPKYQVNFD